MVASEARLRDTTLGSAKPPKLRLMHTPHLQAGLQHDVGEVALDLDRARKGCKIEDKSRVPARVTASLRS